MMYVKMNNVFKGKIVPRPPLEEKKPCSGSCSSMKNSSNSVCSLIRSHETQDINHRVASEIHKLISAGHINRNDVRSSFALCQDLINKQYII